MARTYPHKNKILCLEGLWDNNLEQRLSVKPLLEIISKLNGIKFTHCPCNTVSEFQFHLYNFTSPPKSLRNTAFWSLPSMGIAAVLCFRTRSNSTWRTWQTLWANVSEVGP